MNGLTTRRDESALLHARAVRLARPEPAEPDVGPHFRAVVFLVSGEPHALDIEFVREIVSLRDLCRIPCTPAFVAGVINVHGRIVSAIDLRAFLGLAARGIAGANRAVVLSSASLEIGILVDGVLDVRVMRFADIHPMPDRLADSRSSLVRGATKDGVIVLDARSILADDALLVRDEF